MKKKPSSNQPKANKKGKQSSKVTSKKSAPVRKTSMEKKIEERKKKSITKNW